MITARPRRSTDQLKRANWSTDQMKTAHWSEHLATEKLDSITIRSNMNAKNCASKASTKTEDSTVWTREAEAALSIKPVRLGLRREQSVCNGQLSRLTRRESPASILDIAGLSECSALDKTFESDESGGSRVVRRNATRQHFSGNPVTRRRPIRRTNAGPIERPVHHGSVETAEDYHASSSSQRVVHGYVTSGSGHYSSQRHPIETGQKDESKRERSECEKRNCTRTSSHVVQRDCSNISHKSRDHLPSRSLVQHSLSEEDHSPTPRHHLPSREVRYSERKTHGEQKDFQTMPNKTSKQGPLSSRPAVQRSYSDLPPNSGNISSRRFVQRSFSGKDRSHSFTRQHMPPRRVGRRDPTVSEHTPSPRHRLPSREIRCTERQSHGGSKDVHSVSNFSPKEEHLPSRKAVQRNHSDLPPSRGRMRSRPVVQRSLSDLVNSPTEAGGHDFPLPQHRPTPRRHLPSREIQCSERKHQNE